MFDKVRIRTKLVAIVAAPLAALLILVAIGGAQRRADASEAGSDAARIEVTQRAATLAYAVQTETVFTTALLGGGETIGPDAVKATRVATDDAVSAYRSALKQVDDLQTADRGAIQSVSGQLEFLQDLRDQADRGDTEWSEIAGQYAIFDDALQALISAFGQGITDPDLAASVRSIGALAGYSSAAAREGVVLTGVLAQGSFSDQERNGREVSGIDLRARFDEAVTNAQVALAVYSAQASAEDRTSLRNRLSGASFDVIESARTTAQNAGFGVPIKVDPVEYRAATTDVLDELRSIQTAQARTLIDAAQSEVDASNRSAQFFLILGICIALFAIVIAGIVSSSITRPLAKLTEAVDQVATQQLPRLVDSLRNPAEDDVKLVAESVTDIEPGGGAELEHLGQAVTAIQHVAVDVATEQASLLRKGIGDMFVNLARRNQALLDRQIEYIDQLEADEEDADRLEDLFKLDHMATRMRRNAESLLVLAGAEPARRRGRPVPLADVVRAALGEVEDYTRIDLLSLDEVLVQSSGALDIAHLLSELMENATHFSPPDTRVEIVGHRSRDGYVVSVTDHGIGMTPDQMADANELLAHPPLVGLAMSRSLGFIVIGRLAARIGVHVRLIPSPTGGVTAVVSLPTGIVEDTLPREELPPVEDPAAGADIAEVPAEDPAASWMDRPSTFDEAVAAGADLEEEFASLVDDRAAEARRGHPSQWAQSAEATRSGPQRHPSAGEPDPARGPDDLPVRRPRGDATPPEVTAPSPERVSAFDHEPAPSADAEPPSRHGLFGGPAPQPPSPSSSPSTMPEPLVDAGSARAEPEALPSRRTGSVDRPPTDGLFSGRGEAPDHGSPSNGNGNGNGTGGAGTPTPPRLFGGTEAAPLPMPGGAHVRDRNDAPTPPPVAERTSAGLVRRTPRAAGGADRPLPGGESSARGATTTQRSPDEVRAMLSRFRTGQQQAAGQRGRTGGPSHPDRSGDLPSEDQ